MDFVHIFRVAAVVPSLLIWVAMGLLFGVLFTPIGLGIAVKDLYDDYNRQQR